MRFTRDPSGPLLSVPSGSRIKGKRITGNGGPAVQTQHKAEDIEFEDCDFIAPGPAWNTHGAFIDFGGNIRFNRCRFYGCTKGIYANGMNGPLRVTNSRFWGMRNKGCSIQLDHCKNSPHYIGHNWSDAKLSDGIEDHFNKHVSGGKNSEPAIIEHNWIRGGSSETGCGINVGDGGFATKASKEYGYTVVRYNRLLMVCNVGIGVTGGHKYKVHDNLLYLAGKTAESLTSACVTVRDHADDVEVFNNDGFVLNWLHGGEGRMGAGFWQEPDRVTNLREYNNKWQNTSLTAEQVWVPPGRTDPEFEILLARASARTSLPVLVGRAQALTAVQQMPMEYTERFLKVYAQRLGANVTMTQEQIVAALQWAQEFTQS